MDIENGYAYVMRSVNKSVSTYV